MNGTEVLAEQFEEHRRHLRAVAQRMLGSAAEADDALQETWLKVQRSGTDPADIMNMGGWLTTVVSRVCLTMLDARKRRREDALDEGRLPDPVVTILDDDGPEREALMADAVGVALLVVLEQLQPAERLAFVLHDLFAVPFDDVSQIIDKSPAATRQLASRARRRVQGADAERASAADREVVDAFLAAARGGEFEDLLKVLDPDVVLRADDGSGVLRLIEGAHAVAAGARVGGRGRVPQRALVDGRAGFVGYEDGVAVAILAFTVVDGRITRIDALGDPARVAAALAEAG